ncbi:AbrB family transcriptional regulator [Bacillus sporothermodurans]|uniref:AbrB family transcriptional regulator n=1 Tax=Heyndrickxia sporothermodurans TaxID=46224 RepID=UPI00192B065B|nr:AbrB family transcriptional regulator [Heyndrickxia sporothermodurans]MBL5843282.1 AbrB family transcriptional regulator [Heyndrickxia sporothermodurans]
MIISSIGGLVLSLAGLSIGWMIGTLLIAAFLSFKRPAFLKIPREQKGLPPYWLRIGQCILAIELGQKINLSVVHTFKDHWLVILVMLFLSIIFALISGLVLWKFSQTDMITSFFGTSPGGLSAMPSIAEEVGANTIVVTIIQTMRVFLVVLTIPLFASTWSHHPANHVIANSDVVSSGGVSGFEWSYLLWTLILAFGVWGGYYIGKHLKFPAPWLVGGMLGVGCLQTLGSTFAGHDMIAWWPHSAIILSQIFIASSIGSRFYKEMLTGIGKTMWVSLLTTIGLIVSMLVCAYFVSIITGISFITSMLAFAPGGIAEMATTSAVLDADSTFVVVVQVLRVLVVCIILPTLFRGLKQWEVRKMTRAQSHISA